MIFDEIVGALISGPVGNNADNNEEDVRHVRSALDERLRADARRLRRTFTGFDRFPSSAQQALLDMQFNLGSPKFSEEKWPQLFAAVRAGDWHEAARQSNRIGVGDERNRNTRDLFEKAGGE